VRVERTRAPAAHRLTDDEVFRRAWVRDLATPSGIRRPARRVVRRRRLVTACLVLLALVGIATTATYLISDNISDNVRRVPGVFEGLDPDARPAAGTSLTFLLVGTDSRSNEPTTGSDASPDADPGSVRSDVLMIARLNADRTAASVASIPRDSWVDIPGHGPDRINAAYAIGGPSLLVRTVEDLTGIRFDHFAVIDFAGFAYMVDAVGGIDIDVDVPTTSDGVALRRGVNHLDGREALAYVREHGVADRDLDRDRRQQKALRALVTRVADRQMLSSPAGTFELLDAVSRAVSVDDTLSNGGLRTIASTVNDLEPVDITFVRAPVAGVGPRGPHAPVYLDFSQAGELWAALLGDRVAAYAATHPDDSLDAVAR
jgi:LCP family protein required for cell wall assembly